MWYTYIYIYIFVVWGFALGSFWGSSLQLGQARGVHVPTADLQLTRDFIKFKKFEIFDDAKIGATFQAKKRFVFKTEGTEDWFYAQNALKDSAVICWPVLQRKFPHTKQIYYEPLTNCKEIKLVSIWDVKVISASSVTFKSWGMATLEFSWQENGRLETSNSYIPLDGSGAIL